MKLLNNYSQISESAQTRLPFKDPSIELEALSSTTPFYCPTQISKAPPPQQQLVGSLSGWLEYALIIDTCHLNNIRHSSISSIGAYRYHPWTGDGFFRQRIEPTNLVPDRSPWWTVATVLLSEFQWSPRDNTIVPVLNILRCSYHYSWLIAVINRE